MPGDYTTCTAMFGNGVRIATEIIHQKTFLIRNGRTKEVSECCVAVLSTIRLACAGQRIVFGLGMASVETTLSAETVAVSVSVSAWNDLYLSTPVTRRLHLHIQLPR